MTVQGWAQIVVFLAVLTALVPLVGGYIARVMEGEGVLLARVFGPGERLFYRALGTDPGREQDWKGYGKSVIGFSLASFVLLFVLLRTQGVWPLNPAGFDSMPWDVSFNTAVSFVTNTNWQFYAGETSLSNFSQMAGLTVQNFVSAGVGIAVLAAVIRGFARRSGNELGNFWVDLTRACLYVLLPIAFLGALVLVAMGVVQTLGSVSNAVSLTGLEQAIARGPVASQEVIKMLGTNGGGFFNTNSATPFENPTGLSNAFEILLMILIPASLTATFGRMVGSRRQGWALYAAMTIMLVVGIAILYAAETHGSPAQHAAQIAGGNMEGKEQRFGFASTALFATITTALSCGAVNAAMESLTGIGSMVPIANMGTGEVIFGGVGSGLYGMLLFVLLAVFLAGLMVGRTPEYLGKKIGPRDIKLVAIGVLAMPVMVLSFTALAIATSYGQKSLFAHGAQGFSETLYAYISQGNNNGSAFAGYTGFVQPNAPGNVGAFGITFADLLGGFAMLIGRFVPLLAALAVAGSLVRKKVSPPGPGTMRTDSPTFVLLLIGTVALVALLTFVPALLLGPVVQGVDPNLF